MEVAHLRMTLQLEGSVELGPFPGYHLKNYLGGRLFRSLCLHKHRHEHSFNCPEITSTKKNQVQASPDAAAMPAQQETASCLERCERAAACRFLQIYRPIVEGRTRPLCYALHPPSQARYLPGDQLHFQLRLFGKGIQHLPYFVYALDHRARIGSHRNRCWCRLSTVTLENGAAAKTVIYSAIDKRLLEPPATRHIGELSPHDAQCNRVRIQFLTPAEIKSSKRKLTFSPSDPRFGLLVDALTNRISSLAYFDCVELNVDYKGITEQAYAMGGHPPERDLRKVFYQVRGDRGNKELIKGVVGSVTYEGNELARFLPILKWGELVGVGNKTSYGLGVYKLTVL